LLLPLNWHWLVEQQSEVEPAVVLLANDGHLRQQHQ
jgi:hypothetical protein